MRVAVRRVALALAFGLAAGTASAQTNLRIGLGDDPDGLDPTTSRFYTTRIVFAALCDKLFDIDEKSNIVPQLALSSETSADGKTVTIKLRPGVKFHDGELFDAAAAKYSLERHMNMKGSFRKPELAAVDTVEVVDPLTIKLNLKQPFSPLLSQLTDRAGMMVSPKAAEAAGDKFTYLPIVDSTVRLASLRSGGLDMMERLLATDIKTVRDDPKLKLSKAVSLGFWALLVNVANGPKADNPLGKDPRVRRALELSIDREALNQVVFNGEFTPGNQWVSPEHPYYQKAFPIRPRDIEKAKALLKQAGVTLPVTVDMMVPKGAENEAVAQVVQSMAAEAGFDLKIRLIEFATSFKQAQAGEFQIFQINWSGRIDPDGNSYIFLHTKAPQNDGGYPNPEADNLMQDARLTADAAQRKALYEKLTRIVLNDEPIIYLYHRKLLIAHSKKLEGYRQMPDGLVRVIGLKLK